MVLLEYYRYSQGYSKALDYIVKKELKCISKQKETDGLLRVKIIQDNNLLQTQKDLIKALDTNGIPVDFITVTDSLSSSIHKNARAPIVISFVNLPTNYALSENVFKFIDYSKADIIQNVEYSKRLKDLRKTIQDIMKEYGPKTTMKIYNSSTNYISITPSSTMHLLRNNLMFPQSLRIYPNSIIGSISDDSTKYNFNNKHAAHTDSAVSVNSINISPNKNGLDAEIYMSEGKPLSMKGINYTFK